MIYAKIENNTIVEYPVYEGEIRLRYPNVSFAIPFSPPDEYVIVHPAPQPVINYTQSVRQDTPVFEDGKWKEVYIVEQASPEEMQQRMQAQWNEIRIIRNRKLSSCDWTQLIDAPTNKNDWANYRQNLRDITETFTNPFEVVWPTRPE